VKILRFPIAFLLAIAFTGSLFWFMWSMISATVSVADLKPASKIEFTRLVKDSEVRLRRQQKVQREKPVQTQATPRMSKITFDRTVENKVEMLAPDVNAKGSISRMSVSVGGSDRDVIPLVRIEPEYPQRAAQRGLEGFVVVQFTITPAGTIKDPVVVNAEPKGVFDQAAIKAVMRWKYNPKIEEGTAVERRGVQVRLSFQLEK
jgi:periplasmic protein TonB